MKKIKTRFLNYFSVKKNVSPKKYLFLHVKEKNCVG